MLVRLALCSQEGARPELAWAGEVIVERGDNDGHCSCHNLHAIFLCPACDRSDLDRSLARTVDTHTL